MASNWVKLPDEGNINILKLAALTQAQIDALVPAEGWVVFNTTTDKFQGYDGAAWVDLN